MKTEAPFFNSRRKRANLGWAKELQLAKEANAGPTWKVGYPRLAVRAQAQRNNNERELDRFHRLLRLAKTGLASFTTFLPMTNHTAQSNQPTGGKSPEEMG